MQDLEKCLNEALSQIGHDDVKVMYHLDKFTAIVEYNVKEKKLMCCDCQFYDSTKDTRNAYGLCQFGCGRVRFSNEVCANFHDLRG